MKAATPSLFSAIRFVAKAGLVLAVSPLLPLFGLMWLVAAIQNLETNNSVSTCNPKAPIRPSEAKSLYAELSNPSLDITWTEDSLLNGCE